MAESNNKFRLSKLLTDGGTYFAKELLKVEFSNAGFTDINAFLNDATIKRKVKSLHSKRILHQSQMDFLYPASGTAYIDAFDITLLTCILTNCFKLSASKQTTIAELRTIRNEFLGHTVSYQLDDTDFKQQWQKVVSFLESESNTYLSTACVHHITVMRKTIECKIFTQEAAEKYYHELRVNLEERTRLTEQREQQNKVKLDQMGAEISTMNTKLDALMMRKDLKHMAKSDRKLKNEVRKSRYQTLQLFRDGISSKHTNEESAIFEEGIGDPGLLYIDYDQQFMEAKIVEATAKIEVVKRYEKHAVDIGELMLMNKQNEFVHTLKRKRLLVLVGLPGSGKTFSALSIMSELCEENVKPVVVGKLGDLKKVVGPKQKLVILVDDVLGKYAHDHAVVNEWNEIADLLQEHIRSSNSYFIFTMRRSIYQSAKSNYVCESIFKSPVVIDDKTFMKENLLKLYAGTKRITLSVKQRSDILAIEQFAIGFPVLCSHMDGGFETIIALFKSPYPHIEKEVQALYDNRAPQYIVLLLCLMLGNKLNTEIIDKELLDFIRYSHPFVEKGYELKDSIDTLIGTFLKRDGVYISFLHDCILESTLKVGIQASRDVLLSHLPFEYIKCLYSILKTKIGKPYEDIYKEIFPSLVKKRGNELMKNEDSTTFLISELAEYQSDAEVLEHIVRPLLDVEKLYSNDKNVLHIAAATGKVEAIQCILKFKPEHMQSSDERGWNALHYAVASGSVAAVDFLINPNLSRMNDEEETGPTMNGISPEAKTSGGVTILHIAANTGKIELVKYIINKYKNLVFMPNEKGWNALHCASQKQSLPLINVLIEAGLKPESRTTDGKNILHIAACNGKMEVVRYVTENYKDLIHTVDNNGWNALHLASQEQSVHLVKLLIQTGLKPEIRKTDGVNILHIAANNANMEVVKYITENYKDLIHAVDNDGWNALQYASRKQNIDFINVLIDAGLKPETVKADGENILHIAARNGNMEVVRYITVNYKDLIHTVDKYGWNALHLASQEKSLEMINVLTDAGLPPETRTTDGRNILHIAARNGNVEVVRYITENYKDLIHAVDYDGWNALHSASQEKSPQMISVLIETGLKPETRTTDGANILHIAAYNGNMEVVRYITENYKDLIHTVDNDGLNALHYASIKQSMQIINVLIESGLKPETRKTDGANILHIAASNGNMEVVRSITENYKDLTHTVNNDGWNALQYASQEQNIDFLNVLIDSGLKPESVKADGENILHIAARNGNMEVVRYITVNYKDLIHTVDKYGWNALHLASQEKSLEMINVLTDAGLPPETRTTDGRNILHIAARNGNTEVVRYITENYKDLIHAVDYDGWNALHSASQEKSLQMISVLIEAGLKPETRTADGANILHIAAYNGNIEVVRYITENYKDLIHAVNDGCNALHYAAHGGSVEMVKLLIEASCDPYATMSDISNVLHLLAYHKDFDTVHCILQANPRYRTLHLSQEYVDFFVRSGINGEIRTKDGENILHIAASNGNYDVVKYICTNYYSLVNTVDMNGWNALCHSTLRSSVEQFEYLISKGEEPRDTVDGYNVFLIAAAKDNLQIVEYIRKHIPQLLKTSNIKGENALHCASRGGFINTFTYLVRLGEDVWKETKENKNVLHIAIENDRVEMVKYIIQQYPVILTSRDNNRWTCLHHAAKNSSVGILDYLIDAGLSTEEETLDGRNILDIAFEFGNIDLIMYIKEKGWF